VGLQNHRYFKNTINIYTEFIPQMIFLIFLFFYMTLLMFIKWTRYSASNPDPTSAHCAPSILITFINMVLFKDSNVITESCKTPYMYAMQGGIQRLLVLCAFVCIPWMLFAKPILIMQDRKKRQHQPIMPYNTEGQDTENGQPQSIVPAAVEGSHGGHSDSEEMSEIFIHQGIHTIEYVLGSVSHTASYLRLWALSLAHARKFF
jgi:V-type H+-transporting ATPase subunit a